MLFFKSLNKFFTTFVVFLLPFFILSSFVSSVSTTEVFSLSNAEIETECKQDRETTWDSTEKGDYIACVNDKKLNAASGVSEDDCANEGGLDYAWCIVKAGFFAMMMTLMYVLLGGIAFIIQFVGQFIFTALAYVTNYVLNINPAGSDWLPIWEAPFTAMVSIANIFILASFVYAGVSRVTGFGSIGKQSLGDFFEKIALAALLINLSFHLVAGFVSLMYEIGQFFMHATTSGVSKGLVDLNKIDGVDISDPKGSNIFIFYAEIIKEITNATAENNTSTIEKATGAGIGFFAKNLVLAVVYMFGLGVMWRMLKLLLTRVIILGFMMIMSPVGVVMLFSPIPALQHYGEEWLQTIWKKSIIYPVIVVGL